MAELPLRWHADIVEAWERWLESSKNLGHFDYDIDQPLDRHTATCYGNARALVARISPFLRDANGRQPARLLDHGSSTGFKTLALAESFPAGRVVGIDPDLDGVKVGASIRAHLDPHRSFHPPEFVVAVGEALPFPNGSFDAVVSITVLEHVQNVRRSIAELGRVLRPGGVLYLEAPNYTWPYEPHLRIPVPPASSRSLMKLVGRCLGISDTSFLDHLNLVRPSSTERILEASGFRWRNLFSEKLERALTGDAEDVVFYGRLARLLSVAGKYGLGRAVRHLVLSTGLYPSLIYVAHRR